MNAITHMRSEGALTPRQLDLIRRTVAKDCDNTEFDHFMAVAGRLGLDPLRKQICAMVFNKNNAEKRNMSIITQIDGFRVIAARQGDYRPMETAPIIEYDEAAKCERTNPLGIVRAEVRAWKRHGSEWFPVVGEAYWEEYVPLEQEWAYDPEAGKRQPTGPKVLSDKSPWRRMARVMIAKVAEAQALRRGWPDDLSGVYADEEMQRAVIIDAASEVVAEYQERERLERIGGKDTLLFMFDPTEGVLESVPRGEVADRLARFYEREAKSAQDVINFRQRNEASLKTFWAWAPGDALEMKKLAERQIAALIDAKKSAGAGGADEDAGSAGESSGASQESAGGEAPPASSAFADLKAQGEAILKLDGKRRQSAAINAWRDACKGAKYDLSDEEALKLQKLDATLTAAVSA